MIPGTWSQATAGAFILFIVIGVAICFRPKRRNRRVKSKPPAAETARRPWPLADYSEQYRKQVQWLGDRFLLAKPINHNRNNTKTVLS